MGGTGKRVACQLLQYCHNPRNTVCRCEGACANAHLLPFARPSALRWLSLATYAVHELTYYAP